MISLKNYVIFASLLMLVNCGSKMIDEPHKRPCLQPSYQYAKNYEPCNTTSISSDNKISHKNKR